MTDHQEPASQPADLAPSSDEDNSAPRRWLVPALTGVAIVGGAVGIYAWIGYINHGQYVQSTDDAYVKADGVTISSKLSGYVHAVKVVDNQSVAPGALLVEVDPTDYRIRLAQAQAQESAARASEGATRAQIAEAEAGIDQARASLATAQRNLAYLNGEVSRYRPLVASGAEPKQTLDQFIANRDKAADDAQASAAALAAAEAKVTTIRAQLGQSAAQIAVSATQKDAASTDLATTRIVAPVGGKIASSSVRLGQYVLPGQRLLTIVPVDAIYVEANFKETQIGLMRPGQPATLEVDALPGVTFHGTVASITPGTGATFSLVPPQNATGNFTKIVQRVPVRIRLDAGPESRQVLVPGLSIKVNIDTSSARRSLAAIRQEQDRAAHGESQ